MIYFLISIIADNNLGEIFKKMKEHRKGNEKMNDFLLISDAAKEVKVESHVLRYWEEELHLPIKRNELGHRYYTKEDVERFKQIKIMKEQGLQLKAIKMIMRNGKLSVLPESDLQVEGMIGKGTPMEEMPVEEVAYNNTSDITNEVEQTGKVTSDGQAKGSSEAFGTQNDEDNHYIADERQTMSINIVSSGHTGEIMDVSREEKAKRLQWLLRQLIKDTLVENNQELCKEIKESVIKELDYQFRNREEREEERERLREKRNEEYYQKMDELLRKKSRGRLTSLEKKEKKVKAIKKPKNVKEQNNIMDIQEAGKKAKKKRHSIF